ncbi:hypothetical protein [Methanoplanus limicola]|jgi:hypothetical protein|uniref:Uncharacterized protein n=1 Tax=Methanoplanus limicola DSM 2279 TaxID=937775 RepID=H1Z2N7_9EURY|nr:hypothetical protein [Methanoplanus limicola]EHQ36440.1 hypothetical protein Metlim_2389 [Methanoplanus limicola DSM 2279]
MTKASAAPKKMRKTIIRTEMNKYGRITHYSKNTPEWQEFTDAKVKLFNAAPTMQEFERLLDEAKKEEAELFED